MHTESKIVLTGGHAATTALATIEALRKKGDNKLVWIGSKYAMEGKNTLSLEFTTFPEVGVKCYSIIAGRLQRKWTRYSLWSLAKVPFGFLHALLLLLFIRPKVVLSYGGFAALPVVVAAWLLRAPVIVHEQTIAAGLTNRLSSPFARTVAISREESRKYFPDNKTVLTGNPTGEKFFSIKAKNAMASPPVLFVTGGSRGSQRFNQVVFDVIGELTREYIVVHQCGELDLARAQKVRNSLPLALRKRYEVMASISPLSMPAMFSKADIIVGRSGANTVSEVLAAGRPAIFVPIPWVQHDEQTKNAKLAERAGQAVIIRQDELSAKLLLTTIDNVRKNWKKMAQPADIRNLDKNAAEKLVNLALEQIK